MPPEALGLRPMPPNLKPRTSSWLDAGVDAMGAWSPRVFLLDPDPVTRRRLVDFLRDKGFDVVESADMERAPPAVDLLVIVLGGLGSDTSLQRPKWLAEKPDVPTVVLDRALVFPERTVALGFEPDARLSLPVPPRKLVATIRRAASLARFESLDQDEEAVCTYRFAGWTLHRQDGRLEASDGTSVLLDRREFEVLRAFLTFPHQLLTRQQLIAMVWGSDSKLDNRTLDRPIIRLRRRLGDDVRFPTLIRTIVGSGYQFNADVEKLP